MMLNKILENEFLKFRNIFSIVLGTGKVKFRVWVVQSLFSEWILYNVSDHSVPFKICDYSCMLFVHTNEL